MDDRFRHLATVAEKALFFVVGCQKTGTTWVQHIFNQHPQSVCHDESTWFVHLAGGMQQLLIQFNQKQKAGELGLMTDQQFCDAMGCLMLGQFDQWSKAKPQAIALGEKTPEHAQSLPLISALFPAVKCIHVVRDPRDAVVSGWHHNLKQNKDKFLKSFPNIDTYAKYMVEHHWLRYVSMAEAWGQANPESFVRLAYEDLLEDGPAALVPACDMLGLASDADTLKQTLARAQEASKANTAQTVGNQPNDEANTSGSFFRQGKAGGWQDALPESAVALIETMAADWMDALGYPPRTANA